MYEPGSFVPVAQAVRDDAIELLDQPEYGDYYRQDEDPLWLPPSPAPTINSLAWYQCDHLGTPQELTDEHSEIAWSAEYRAWGLAKEAIRKASSKTPIANPIRFQGQYHDHESGLHYNRYRYYDPSSGRFISKDPIGLAGGINAYVYGPNPVGWIDPLGLMGKPILGGTPKDAQKAVNKGQGPSDITRIDEPESSVPGSQWHAHCKCSAAINQDGSMHDKAKAKGKSVSQLFSKKTLKWLQSFGWKPPGKE
ncbi:hypothetical protein WS75_16085 [Burkholderia sp. FL-7-2-10-S1-D7]|uniref:RHS repeat domain-containing protein n=1 Tax=Burkholderia sp. FL-7-2-10-S1-D7 TaxID=1637866 RepID=UPI000753E98F|nr:RHS repeat-associated core domain-containing protein [Burkholderia sp. FL-7-2-10-S1-D7]KVF74560.1 hypothetical protein WS75_16085 [Burkholderia sp. FL-7-2-10-S1-D7]